MTTNECVGQIWDEYKDNGAVRVIHFYGCIEAPGRFEIMTPEDFEEFHALMRSNGEDYRFEEYDGVLTVEHVDPCGYCDNCENPDHPDYTENPADPKVLLENMISLIPKDTRQVMVNMIRRSFDLKNRRRDYNGAE